MSVPDDLARLAGRVADELRRLQATVHERQACPKCGAPRGERCYDLRRSPAHDVPGRRRTTHAHRERLRADGIAER